MHSFATFFLVMCPQNGMELYKNWGGNKMRQRSCTGSPKRDSRHSVCQQFRPNWVHCKYCWKVWRRSAPNRRNNSAGKPNFLRLHFQNRSHIRWRRPWTQWQIHTSEICCTEHCGANPISGQLLHSRMLLRLNGFRVWSRSHKKWASWRENDAETWSSKVPRLRLSHQFSSLHESVV